MTFEINIMIFSFLSESLGNFDKMEFPLASGSNYEIFQNKSLATGKPFYYGDCIYWSLI